MKTIVLIALTMVVSLGGFAQRAQDPNLLGELTNMYTCMMEGYTIRVYRPAHVPSNSSTRQIHVETHAVSFYARFAELQVLLQYHGLVISYDNLGMQNVPPYEYCDRDGYRIVDENAYYVTTTNPNNYTGNTGDLGDSNLDLATREHLVTTFNTYKQQHNIDLIPVGCDEGCITVTGGVIGGDDDFRPGAGYTTADGSVEEWDFDDWLFGGSGTTVSVGGVFDGMADDFSRPGSLSDITGVYVGGYYPLVRIPRISLGVILNGSYIQDNTDPSTSLAEPVNIVRQDFANVRLHTGESYSQERVQGGLGLQLNFNLARRWMLSAIAQAGYMDVTHSAFSLIQEGRVGAQDFSFVLLQRDEVSHSSLYYSPGLRLNFLLNRMLHIWAGADYTYGGVISYSQGQFMPNGEPNADGFYPYDSYLSGRTEQQVIESDYNRFGIGIGVSVAFSPR